MVAVMSVALVKVAAIAAAYPLRRLPIVIGVALAYWLLVLCNPIQFAVADLLQPGANDNGYSPYSMVERCHPSEFHIPVGLPC
jgi:hypothetical protein